MVNSLFRWFLSFLSIKSIFHVSLLYASFFSMFRNIRLLTFVQCSVGYMHMHSPEGESRSFWGAGGPGVEDSQWCDVWSCGTAWILHESTPFAEQPQPLRFLLTLRLEWKFLPRLADICIKCATAAGCLGYIIFFSFCVFFYYYYLFMQPPRLLSTGQHDLHVVFRLQLAVMAFIWSLVKCLTKKLAAN